MKMTSKERILKTLDRKIPDRIPWAPLIEYNFLNSQDKEIRELGVIGVCRMINIDVIAKNTVSAYKSISKNVRTKTFINGRKVKIPEEESNWQLEVYNMFSLYKYRDPSIKFIEKSFETPIGILKSSYENNPVSKTVFQKEFFIKEKKDIKILEYMYKDLEFVPNYNEIKKEEELIGKDGIVAAGAPGSPVIELIEEYIGLEKFLFFLKDFPEEIESLYDIMLTKNIKACEVASRSPCPLVVVWEDTGTGLYSPKIFKKYIAKALKEYTNVSHKFEKCIFVHSCGFLNGILEDLVRTGIDGITDMASFPIGDIDFLDVRKRVGNDIILTGGIDPTVITSSEKGDLEKGIIKLINDMKLYSNFIIGSADAVPADTPIENLKLISEIVENYGYY